MSLVLHPNYTVAKTQPFFMLIPVYIFAKQQKNNNKTTHQMSHMLHPPFFHVTLILASANTCVLLISHAPVISVNHFIPDLLSHD